MSNEETSSNWKRVTRTLSRAEDVRPSSCPARWLALLGGPDCAALGHETKGAALLPCCRVIFKNDRGAGPDEQRTTVCAARTDIPSRRRFQADRVSRRLPDPRSTYPHLTYSCAATGHKCNRSCQVPEALPLPVRDVLPLAEDHRLPARHDLITLCAETSSTSPFLFSSRAGGHACRPDSVIALQYMYLRAYDTGPTVVVR